MAKKLRYIGGGFLAGVPARDLSAGEAKIYGLERLLASGLYEDNYPPQVEEENIKDEDIEEEVVEEISDWFDEIEVDLDEEDE